MKKLIALLFVGALITSCSKEKEVTQADDTSADYTLDSSAYDDSNLGIYKGVFSTYDSAERGTFEIKIGPGNNSRAILTLVNGKQLNFSTSTSIEEGVSLENVEFVADGSSFKFSVDGDGSNPIFSDVSYFGSDSAIKVLKETSRGAVTAQTGTWGCDVGCSGSGTWNLTFTTGDGTGDYASGDGNILTMIMFNGADIGTTTNQQNTCVDDGNVTSCELVGITNTVGAAGGIIGWTGAHRYLTAVSPNCSEASGDWAGGSLSGTWTSDVTCFDPGNFSFTATPITINAEGTGCSDPGDNAIVIADFTDSGITSTCNNGTADVWYTFTASTTGLTVSVPNGGGLSEPSFTVYDLGLTEVACNGGGFFGDFTITGLTPTTDYYLRVSTSADADFCIEAFDVPTGPPANDLCADAIAIACDDTVTGNTTSATDSDTSRGNDVWYTFDGTSVAAGTEIQLSLCASSYDTWLGVYDDCAFTTTIASNDDSCGGQSEVSFINDGSTNYVIRVDGFNSTSFGAYELTVSCVIPDPPPANDDCAGALPIGVSTPETGDTTDATSSGTGTCGTFVSGPDVWYVFTAPSDGDFTAALCGSSYDTKIQVFDGTCGALNCLGGNDDSCGLASEFTFTATAATDYYILVAGFSANAGAYTVQVDPVVAPLTGEINVEKASSKKLTEAQQYEAWKNEQ